MKQTILFDTYTAFKEQSSEVIPALINTNTDVLPEIFRNFKYPISSCPVIVDKELTQKLTEVSTLIPKLLHKIPRLYFKDDAQEIADFYFDGDETIAQFSMMCQEKEVPVSCRLDLSLTTTGFKVLEVNMGSSIGGMEFQNFEPIIRNTHNILSNVNTGKQFNYRKTQTLYIKFVVEQILAYTQTNSAEINIFLVSREDSEKEYNEVAKNFFDALLKKELQRIGKRGNVYMDTVLSLKMKSDGLYFENKNMHAVLILDFSLNTISPDLFRAFIMNSIYFPDHLGTTFIRDKRNLALLRRLANENKFEGTQNELVLQYIPWTELVTDADVIYENETHNIIKLLKTNKDKFVIKISDGLQGNDVFIGKFMSITNWENAIENALATKKYIAQEFSDSLNLLAPNKENEWTPHKLVWGSFGFGDTYAGSWVRMSPVEKTTGVINSATGAVEAIVYEQI
ncbi:hypothetical protein [uncultured Kordia sp.]|uniref:hypothetical protein n=1 Tax=uncultured Kordia sp. TaxID=507699 RepID=UPI00262A5C8A|nr:hypothetical protein [uncultured Kordia sp.]